MHRHAVENFKLLENLKVAMLDSFRSLESWSYESLNLNL